MLSNWTSVRMGRAIRALAVAVVIGLSHGSANAQDPNYTLTVGSAVTAPGGSVTLPVTLDSLAGQIQGWSFGMCYDTAQLDLTNVALGTTSLTVNQGNTPEFQQINVEPNGWTMGVVICLTGCAVLEPGNGYELATAQYETMAPAGSSFELCACSTVGTPTINAVVVVGGISIIPVINCGTIEVVALQEFIRSDANDDGNIDISDGIWLLNYLFQGGPLKPCVGAADSNNDGSIDTGDAIYTIGYIFAGGAPPAAPFPDCGTAVGQGLTTCEVFETCP